MRRVFVVSLLAGALILCSFASSEAKAGWGPVETISVANENAFLNDLSASPSTGEAIATWFSEDEDFDTFVVGTWRNSAGTWQRQVLQNTNLQEAFPKTALAPGGQGLIGWDAGKAFVALKNPGGGFSAPILVSQTGVFAGGSDIAAGSAGHRAVVWTASKTRNSTIQARIVSPGGSLSGIINVSPPKKNNYADRPAVAVSPSGTVAVAYMVFVAKKAKKKGKKKKKRKAAKGTWRIAVSTISPSGKVSGRQLISSAKAYSDQPDVAFGPQGQIYATWWTAAGKKPQAQVIHAAYRAGSKFSKPQALSSPSRHASWPELTTGSNGGAILTWWDHARGSSADNRSMARQFNGSWGPLLQLSGPGNAYTASAVFGSNGLAWAAIYRQVGCCLVIEVMGNQTTLPGTTTKVSEPSEDEFTPQLGALENGKIIVGWHGFALDGSARSQVRVFTP